MSHLPALVVYPLNIPFKNEIQRKTFSDKEKQNLLGVDSF